MIRSSADGPRSSPITSGTGAFLTRSISLPSKAPTSVARQRWHFVKPSVIPGFGLTLGYAVTYLTLIVLIPLAGLVIKAGSLGWAQFWAIASDERTVDAL